MDNVLMLGIPIYLAAVEAETRRRAAQTLLDIGSPAAPDWIYAGWLKLGIMFFALVGGIGGAAMISYAWTHILGSIGAVAFFLFLLFAKYFVSMYRAIRIAAVRARQSSTMKVS